MIRSARLGAAALGAVLALTLAAAAGSAGLLPQQHTPPDLHAEVVALDGDGQLVPLSDGGQSRLVDGLRALDARSAQRQRDWLDAGPVPGAGTRWAGMGRDALLDLDVLVLGNGAALAGWTEHWRYVWPRDAAFVAAAMARTGRLDRAEQVLAHLQRLAPERGVFQARYLPDGSGDVPDRRGPETDGSGWLLWAIGELEQATPSPDRPALLRRLTPLLGAATRGSLSTLREGDGLPPPGLDYWEVPDKRVSLGLAAPLLAGLEAAPDLLRLSGSADLAALIPPARTAASELAERVQSEYGRYGFPRFAGGPAGAAKDTSLAFLMPPFRSPGRAAGAPIDASALTRAWTAAQHDLLRPAGGLAPGARWRADGISWTPETAVFALTAAASGDRATAEHWLDWLDAHRTRAGALPEKVLDDGSPASVAPLAWTAATVVLTLALLDER